MPYMMDKAPTFNSSLPNAVDSSSLVMLPSQLQTIEPPPDRMSHTFAHCAEAMRTKIDRHFGKTFPERRMFPFSIAGLPRYALASQWVDTRLHVEPTEAAKIDGVAARTVYVCTRLKWWRVLSLVVI